MGDRIGDKAYSTMKCLSWDQKSSESCTEHGLLHDIIQLYKDCQESFTAHYKA